MKTIETPRFEVKTKVKFGMICGYYVYDNQEKKSLAYDFDEDLKNSFWEGKKYIENRKIYLPHKRGSIFPFSSLLSTRQSKFACS
jgi:hypothetical protein